MYQEHPRIQEIRHVEFSQPLEQDSWQTTEKSTSPQLFSTNSTSMSNQPRSFEYVRQRQLAKNERSDDASNQMLTARDTGRKSKSWKPTVSSSTGLSNLGIQFHKQKQLPSQKSKPSMKSFSQIASIQPSPKLAPLPSLQASLLYPNDQNPQQTTMQWFANNISAATLAKAKSNKLNNVNPNSLVTLSPPTTYALPPTMWPLMNSADNQNVYTQNTPVPSYNQLSKWKQPLPLLAASNSKRGHMGTLGTKSTKLLIKSNSSNSNGANLPLSSMVSAFAQGQGIVSPSLVPARLKMTTIPVTTMRPALVIEATGEPAGSYPISFHQTDVSVAALAAALPTNGKNVGSRIGRNLRNSINDVDR
jgi:hypothetical protein